MVLQYLLNLFILSKSKESLHKELQELQYESGKLPFELVNIILEYDGRIKYKYKHKNQIDYYTFVNVIHKHDTRYNVIKPIIHKKYQIIKNTETRPNDTGFYFEFDFDTQPKLCLCYDYNWSYNNVFEICYTDMKGSGHVLGSDQIRTYI
jgi:hypothetical protein